MRLQFCLGVRQRNQRLHIASRYAFPWTLDCLASTLQSVDEHLPRATALLVIDTQKAIDHPSWGRRNNPGAEANIARLLSAWRHDERPIIHVRHESREPGSTYLAGQSGCAFKPEAEPAPGELIVTKHTNAAFIGTELDILLRRRAINTLVIAGVITNNSVEATARMAGNLGYTTYVAADATATFDKRDLDGRLHAAEDVHALSLANLHGEYATVRTTEEIIALSVRA